MASLDPKIDGATQYEASSRRGRRLGGTLRRSVRWLTPSSGPVWLEQADRKHWRVPILVSDWLESTCSSTPLTVRSVHLPEKGADLKHPSFLKASLPTCDLSSGLAI